MKISFNPSNSNKNILDLIKSNKDIIFDLKGHNIFARGVEFKGTDTNTWRPVVDNLTSNSTTSSLSANQGRVLKALIDGKSDSGHNHDGRYVKKTGDTMSGALNFANGTWNKVGDDSYVGDCNISGHFGIKAANTTYPGITFFDNSSARLGSLTAYSGNIKYGAYSLQFLDNGNTRVNASTWVNPFSAYDKDAVKDGQAVCVWGQRSYLSNLSSDSGNIALYLKRINANAATLNMILNGEYYANGNQRLAHISEIPSSLKNPHALTISLNGTSQGPYDGSVAKNINITPGSIGAATSGHNHDGRYVYNYGRIQMDGASVNKNALGMSTTSGITGDWWHILQAAWNGEYRWNSQIAFPTQNRNGMYYRSGLDDNTKWGSWVKLLDIGNSYVKDGKGIINGTTITQVNNADTLDGTHLNGLLTSVSNVNNGISVTVGGTTKSVSNISVNLAQKAVGPALWIDEVMLKNEGFLASDYTDRYNTEEFCKALSKYLFKHHEGHTVFGTIYPNSQGMFTANIYQGKNSNGYPEYITIHYYPLGGDIINCGTVSGNWYYNQIPTYRHTHSWQSITDKIVGGNEFNIVNAGYNNTLAINYLPIDNRNGSATITQYNIYNGNRGLASIYAYRFKADGKSCMWKDARNYAPFCATFNGGFEPILDIKTKSGDWSIGSYDSAGDRLIFSFTSDSDFNAGVNGTAWYYISADGIFSGASRYINHTPGSPQSYMYSTSTGTYDGAIQIREVNGVLNNQSAWGYAPRITFHWGQRYAKGFGMRSDGQFAVDDVPIALTSNVLTFDNNNANYLGANFNNPDFSKKAASTYIECWDGAGGWWNWMAGKFMKAGSSDAYVLLGGGGHKPLSEFQLGNGSYLPYNGWWANGNGQDVNNSNGMIFAYASHKNSPFSSAWGIITTFDYTYNSDYKFQLAANGYYNAMYYRSRSSDRGGWTSWAQVIDTGNISSQRVAYATSAGSVSNSLNIFGVSYNGSAAKTVTTSTFVSQLPEGTSTVTDGTMFITSWASDSGFADTNAVNVPYKRKASCLWSYIDSKVSSKYLPLAGGTMNGNARIGHGSGNLYIGNSGNDGWVYTQDIASQKGTDKWWIRESGAAHFGNVYICTKSDYITYDSSIIECYTGNNLYLNYYSTKGVNLCNGGGTVQIGPYTTGDTGNNKLFVNGSEFIQGASNVRDHVFANGFRHRSHNSNDSVLLAGGGYSVGCIIKYWAIYSIQLRPTTVNFSKMSGNHSFISTMSWEKTGSAILEIKYPSGFSESSTMIFGNGDHQGYYYDAPVYITISKNYGSNDKLRITLANDTSLDEGEAYLYFLCMG